MINTRYGILVDTVLTITINRNDEPEKRNLN